MKETSIKIIFSGAVAAVSAYFNLIFIPLAVLVTVMVCDYVTGITSAWIEKSISSRTGIIGIIKKICYLGAVAVGITVDWIVSSALNTTGIDAGNFYAFGVLVTVWLIINELISILENLSSIGVPLPGFLKSAVSRLSKTIEKSAGEDKTSE